MANNIVQENGNFHEQVAVVMVPLPAQGHLNQLLHLSRLIAAYKMPVYYVGSTTHIRQATTRIHGWDPSSIATIEFHEIPTPHFQNPSPNPNSTNKFPSQMVPSLSATKHLREPIFAFVDELSRKFRRVVVVYDSMMAYVVEEIDAIKNAESYCFRSISAFTVYSFYWENAGRPNGKVADILKEIPAMDGCFSPEFSEFRDLQRYAKAIFAGDIYNSSKEIEGLYLKLLSDDKMSGTNKVWAIGPFNPIEIHDSNSINPRHKSLEWLDKQEENSVIFVSFGTTSSLSDEQIEELALGLERSEQKFVWVVRDADKGDIFDGETRRIILPGGFEERVAKTGLIVRDWAPQIDILAHFATGGFLSHCGWNSCMESISFGVPIATWPMHSDQPRNAFLVTKVLNVGVEVKDWARRDELVTSNRVEEAVRKLMASEEGDEMRKRVVGLADAVKKATMEGGTTRMEMDSFIDHINR